VSVRHTLIITLLKIFSFFRISTEDTAIDDPIKRLSYLEVQVQELRAENTRLGRETHALSVLAAENTTATLNAIKQHKSSFKRRNSSAATFNSPGKNSCSHCGYQAGLMS
jgi:hypothetical protein